MAAVHGAPRRAATLSVTPAALGGLFAAGLLLGGLTGAIATAQVDGSSHGPTTAVEAGSAPAPTFDAVRFRAEERSVLGPAPTFDAVRFRAEEEGLAPGS